MSLNEHLWDFLSRATLSHEPVALQSPGQLGAYSPLTHFPAECLELPEIPEQNWVCRRVVPPRPPSLRASVYVGPAKYGGFPRLGSDCGAELLAEIQE